MGVVYAPALQVWAITPYSGKGAWKIPDLNDSVKIKTHRHELPNQSIAMAWSVVAKTSTAYISRMSSAWNYDLVPLGSAALKA